MTPIQLRVARKRARLSQTELGELLGLSITTIWKWEAGEAPIPKQGCIALTAVLEAAQRNELARTELDPPRTLLGRLYWLLASAE